MVQKSRIIINSLIAATFLFGMFGGVQGQNVTVLPAHLDAVQAAEGPGTPPTTWSNHLEDIVVYLHRDTLMPVTTAPLPDPVGPTETPIVTIPQASSVTDAYFDYERPIHIPDQLPSGDIDPNDRENQRAIATATLTAGTNVAQPVFLRFNMADGLLASPSAPAFESDVRFYRVYAEIEALCPQGTQNLQLEVEQLRFDGTNWVPVDTSSSGGHQPFAVATLRAATAGSIVDDADPALHGTKLTYRYTGDVLFGDPATQNGKVLPEGSRLQINIRPAGTSGASCTIYYDTNSLDYSGNTASDYGYTSFVQFRADSGRISAWVDDRDGNVATGLPSADSTAAERRRFLVQVAQTSVWPLLNEYTKDGYDANHAPLNGPDYLDNQWNEETYQGVQSEFDIENDHRKFLRIWNKDTNQLAYDTRTGTWPALLELAPVAVTKLASGANLRTFTFGYTGGLVDGNYQAEVYTTGTGSSLSQLLSVGLKDFTISAVGSTTRQINVNEPTVFRVAIANIGGDRDTYTTSVTPPGANWNAEVINGRLTLEPGGSEEVLVRVTPSSAATAGQSRSITVTTVSAFPNEVTAKTLTLTASVVSGGTAGAALLGNPGTVEVFPGGDVAISGLRVQNTAPFVDTYLLRPVFPSDIKGWSATVAPASRTIPAASLDDFVLNLRAPADAPDGLKFNLVLQAQRIGGTVATTTMPIPVEVVYVPDVQLFDRLPGRSVRTDGSFCTVNPLDPTANLIVTGCGGATGTQIQQVSDTDNSLGVVHRVEITNPRPIAETYSVAGRWYKGTDNAAPSSGCNNDNNNGPDYWRVQVGAADTITNSDGVAILGPRGGSLGTLRTWAPTFTVPAETTRDIFVRMNWIEGGCGTVQNNVGYRLIVTSLTNQGLVRSIDVDAVRTVPAGDFEGGQRWSGGLHDVHIETARVEGPSKVASTSGVAPQTTSGYSPASFNFVVVNEANERDSLIIEVPNAGNTRPGWTSALSWIGNEAGGANTGGIRCDHPQASNPRRITCDGMGTGDQATLRLTVVPSSSAPLRSVLELPVTVKSNDDGTKSDIMTFTTQTVGRFSFDALSLKSSRSAGRGTDVTLPFQVNNVGTEGDTYTISIIDGPADWKPRLSSDQSVFIPAQKGQTGFVVVTVPTDAATGVANAKTFRVEVKSDGGAGVRVLDFSVQALSAPSFALSGDPSDSMLLTQRGAANTIAVVATGASLNGKNVAFTAEQGALPAGWSVVGGRLGTNGEFIADTPTNVWTPTGSNNQAVKHFQVTPPVDALGTSRVPLLVTATADGISVGKDLVMTLQAEIALHAELVGQMPQTIVAGGEVVYQVDIINDALARDTITLTNTALIGPLAGWSVSYQPAELTLGPLEARTIDVIVNAPVNAPAGQNATFEFFATSVSDPGVFDSLSISTVVGFNQLTAIAKQPVIKAGPDEVVNFVVTVFNNGTLPDTVRGTHVVETTGFQEFLTVTVPGTQFEIPVNGSVDVPVTIVTSATVPAEVSAVTSAIFRSTISPTILAAAPLTIEVLPYKALDVDGDTIKEYAVDRDGVPANGFESFSEARAPGGKTARVPDLASFLTPAARASFTKEVTLADGSNVTVFEHIIDGDKDGKVDFLLDHTGDGLPNTYWDPDRGHTSAITVLQDIDADAVADYFVATKDDQLSAVYNLRTGRFTPLISVDLGGPGTACGAVAMAGGDTLDYIVDKNENGLLDADETVLYSGGGILVTVLKVDVDGDGRLDDVFDVDGDGRVDCFVRNGETVGRAITLRDVDGDGILDWVYDSNLDGRGDSYYNPATQTGGNGINFVESFSQLVRAYWYVPAIFGVVLVLFVVLVAVTRR